MTTDRNGNDIMKFNKDGKFLMKWGSNGTGTGHFNSPHGLTVDASGNVYVTDMGNCRVQKFNSDGKFITRWGPEGTGNGQFKKPEDVVVGPSGNVYVSDTQNSRIQKFTSDGEFITTWTLSYCVKKFTSDGEFITSWGSEGMGKEQFWLPHAITIDSSDNVYVSDSGDEHHKKPPCP